MLPVTWLLELHVPKLVCIHGERPQIVSSRYVSPDGFGFSSRGEAVAYAERFTGPSPVVLVHTDTRGSHTAHREVLHDPEGRLDGIDTPRCWHCAARGLPYSQDTPREVSAPCGDCGSRLVLGRRTCFDCGRIRTADCEHEPGAGVPGRDSDEPGDGQ